MPSARRPETQSSRSASTADPGREPPGAATLQEVHSRPCFRFGSHHTSCTKRIFTSRSHHSPSRRGSRGEKNQERFSESSPKSAESPEPFWSSRRSLVPVLGTVRQQREVGDAHLARQPWSPGKKPASLYVCDACGGRGGFPGRWCQHTLAAVGTSTPDRRPSPTIPVICPRTNVF